ncbi:YgiT-type zinc finger protein [Dehalococcoidales bacterium]|nr:YgiT-type zinc finger protein [Dehalococcoidales bacterium]MCL0052984.1 YgiT-type zinc finger protein [Dehalococcoidales bacterium]MCL0091830.1 YgiT-type zinc finger protein [Dehalococcoidales bacterium]
MKCVICKSPDVEKKLVEEEIRSGQDIVIIPIEVMVCLHCGERYYDRRMMRFLEETESKIASKQINLSPVGKVFRPTT